MNAIMSDSEFRKDATPVRSDWEGFAEVDRAIAENRLTEYRFKKAWADPWSRRITLVVAALIVAVFAFLVGASNGLW